MHRGHLNSCSIAVCQSLDRLNWRGHLNPQLVIFWGSHAKRRNCREWYDFRPPKSHRSKDSGPFEEYLLKHEGYEWSINLLSKSSLLDMKWKVFYHVVRKLNFKTRCHKMEVNSPSSQWATWRRVSQVLVRHICILLYVECWIKDCIYGLGLQVKCRIGVIVCMRTWIWVQAF